MKVNWNSKYTTIAVYSFIVAVLSTIFYLIASEVNLFKIQVSKYINTLQPIIIGFVMAYIFNFILEFFEEYLLDNILSKMKSRKLNRIIGIILTYLTVFLLLYLFLNFVLPQLLSSIIGLVNDIPDYFMAVNNKINDFTNELQIQEEYYEIILVKWNEFVDYILRFATNLIPKLGNLTKNILSSIWNIVLGVIVSIYLLLDKEKFKALSKKITISIFSEKNANRVMELVRRSDSIFGRFLSGKILDSLIIGILTFIILSIAKIPYATLVSFIIGITNIIPFFGPFIGAIPSFFIILFVSPIKALWFLIIILIIQQIDGNIIGPKILGDSLGISAFWILFSLLVAGKIFGFVGLVIGVPLFVFIYSIIKDIVEYRLNKKGLPKDTKEYY
ncbi:AI-2E family transporter [Schnuerera sp.]|uniref:AI-2E family transporter n=1 Tax=Schnuerera sp. TaxID=2794844 RepID=UPI002CAD7C16|nr:AI-2E family transporter [Schnuerera sp.]HSH35410.1 AI-2E family transporter [Schnuerera sp.]